MRHLEYGLRFPLNGYVMAIIRAMNVAVVQLHPLAMRTIIGFVWLCLFKGEAPTVNLFRRLHHLKPSISGRVGWYSVQTEQGYVSVDKLSSCKDWQGRWVYVKVPDDYPLPRSFQHQVNLRCETRAEHDRWVTLKHLKMDASRVHLKEDERLAMRLFEVDKSGMPKRWIPPTQIILQDEPLCYVGLIPALARGEWGRCEARHRSQCSCFSNLDLFPLLDSVSFADHFGPDLSEDILRRMGLHKDKTVANLHPKALAHDRRTSPNDLMEQMVKVLSKEEAQARVVSGVVRRTRKTKLSAAAVSTPVPTPIPSPKKVEIVDIPDEGDSNAEGSPLIRKRKGTASTAGKEVPPPVKKAKHDQPQSAIAHVGQQAVGSSAQVGDQGATVNPSSQKAFVSQPRASGQIVTTVPSPQKASVSELIEEGTKLIRELARWNVVTGARLMEQEKAVARAVHERNATKQVAASAADLLNEQRLRGEAEKALLAERKLREDAEKEVLAERAKAEAAAAEAAKLLRKCDLVQGRADLYLQQRNESRGLFKAQAEVVRGKEAIIKQKEVDIEMLQTVMLPKLCAEFRDLAEDAAREVIGELFPLDGSFPWGRFDVLLDDKLEAKEKAAVEKAKEAVKAKMEREAAAEKAALAEKARVAKEEAERMRAAEAAEAKAEAARKAAGLPTEEDAATDTDGRQQQA
ncbi:uncharacterized protein LOC141590809 [Silene latifolia]|uniref:uncharacterized protein LOC141590809 n=1 Tax=Silene latifolia TaxID=37657 RepID=UPI003D7879DD